MTLVAHYGLYLVRFNANGATGTSPEPIGFDRWDEVKMPNPSDLVPPRAGQRFHSWNTASNGSGTRFNANEEYLLNRTSDLLLFAIWVDA
jgi:hypothetical protein